ncbi:Aa_trans-domain-containing protein [Fragilariopsis cylindrus CCMP1102]|uniref:Aa_trans-domain-containing protein n=1 Tax=Fragilariopsis cylindrus CCMP1102 TaxID=635003 RepID=A0A1E7F969_9STRA|nr:Aa_trans-domain-containing protein [Fragilariopsis cylindrus CCMP1102]|eukprot:OEU14686.1 Aa_trans-domain-containing protein [Fragilariopsis cylindrus CCMP1102]
MKPIILAVAISLVVIARNSSLSASAFVAVHRRQKTTTMVSARRRRRTNEPPQNHHHHQDGRKSSLLYLQTSQQEREELELLELSNDPDLCEIGINLVEDCSSVPATESQLSVSTNLAKCICGAGSFALPHVFLEEGVLGGILAITACGWLSTITMHSLADSRLKASAITNTPITSYVQLAQEAIGDTAAKIVFALTLCASLGVCSTYLVFIGQTLESMSCDQVTTQNIVRTIAPDLSESTWEGLAALVLVPLSLIRDYSIFAFTSALGVVAVIGGILVTLAYGVFVEPGGGLSVSLNSIETLPMWPSSFGAAFGGSFGTLCYLFAINFLTFPIMNSIKEPREYNGAVSKAVSGVWLVNVAFAIVALGFYREDTQDLVLANLSNGPYLSALKLLLCVDLLFTFPIVFSSGRQILETAFLERDDNDNDASLVPAVSVQRLGIVGGAVGFCYALAQVGGFGAVANLVGGVAQGTLAFIVPSAVALSLARKDGGKELTKNEQNVLYGVAAFGVLCVSAVSYFTVSEVME